MTKDEAIEILENACKGLARNEDFFKSPKEIMGDTLDAYSKSQKSAIPIVRLSSLADDWFNKQVEYEKVASNSDSWQHQVRFNAKAQATRDCWKELQRIIEDEA